MINNRGGFVQFRGWQSLLITFGFLLLLYFITRGLYYILSLLALPLLLATIILKYQVILNFFKGLGDIFQRSPVLGIGAGLLVAFLHPFVVAFLFFRAYAQFKSGRTQEEVEQQKMGEYVDYEEVNEAVDTDTLLEELNREKLKEEDELNYWDLLDDDKSKK